MEKIPPYPISFKRWFEYFPSLNICKLDNNGVLMYKIPYTNQYDYYPVSIAQYSLVAFEIYIETKKEKYLRIFQRNVDWLYHNIKIKGDVGIWEHNFTLPYGYNFKIPWIHGMAQSLGASALLRAYLLTGNETYYNAAKLLLGVFEKEIHEGGVKFVDENNYVWYEEYGVLPPPHILNGFMYILIGLYEMHELGGHTKAKNLLRDGIKTLKENIHRYDVGFWSLYDSLFKYPATPFYHNLHIHQLGVMHEISGEDIYIEYAKKWEKYSKSKINLWKAKYIRLNIHLRRYGLLGCIRRYFEIKRYYETR